MARGIVWGAVVASVAAGCGDDGSTVERRHCEVAIIGGGAGGLHTAFRLAPSLGDGVCLFEKEWELGGRIKDIPRDVDDASSPRWGAGALRVMEGQDVLFGLATELNVALEVPDTGADLISARGGFGFSKDAFVPRYAMSSPVADQETKLYDKLRMGPMRSQIETFPDFRSYIRASAGVEEYHFLRDMSRFRADFEAPLDARGYLDYLDEEWDVCCQASYPVGGMSAFIRGMETKATADGAQIFKGEPVTEVRRGGAGYVLVTGRQEVTADKVVLAIPPHAFPYLRGDVIDDIEAQQQFKDLIGIKVATVTQWWPNRWWANVADPAATTNGNVWRAWTTEHCLNFIEIPISPYGVAQNVTRSVYDDNPQCVEFWEQTAARGTAAVEAEIKRGLEYMFNNNGASTPATVTIPNPTKTYVQIWPGAWYWLRAGSTYTNADIFAWAVEPLPGENVALVGEGFNPQRSGWSDGAYKSSINLLNRKYGMALRGLQRTRTPARPVEPMSTRARR